MNYIGVSCSLKTVSLHQSESKWKVLVLVKVIVLVYSFMYKYQYENGVPSMCYSNAIQHEIYDVCASSPVSVHSISIRIV